MQIHSTIFLAEPYKCGVAAGVVDKSPLSLCPTRTCGGQWGVANLPDGQAQHIGDSPY